MMWAAVLVTALGCYLLKLAGLSVPPRILERPLVERIADLIPVALLSALIAVQAAGALMQECILHREGSETLTHGDELRPLRLLDAHQAPVDRV